MIPPLDESTPVSHTHWDSAVIGPSESLTSSPACIAIPTVLVQRRYNIH